MNFHPIWPVIYARSNSTGRISNLTGHEILLKLGWNSWIYTQFNWAWNTAQIGLKFNGFTPNSTSQIYSQFDWSNSTSQIGSKWGHEILLKLGWNSMDLLPIQLVKLGVNGGMKYCSNWVEIMDLLPIQLVKFTPNLTSQIQPVKLGVNGGMKYCSNWVEIQWIYSQFDRSNWD